MKKLLTTLLLSTTAYICNAQCSITPICQQSILFCNVISDTVFYGNQCFEGYSSIENTSFIGFNWLKFHSITASINIQSAINLDLGSKLYNYGYAVNYWGNIIMNGTNTIIIGPNCTVQLSSISATGTGNKIYMASGSKLYIGLEMVRYFPGNTYNGIQILPCPSYPVIN